MLWNRWKMIHIAFSRLMKWEKNILNFRTRSVWTNWYVFFGGIARHLKCKNAKSHENERIESQVATRPSSVACFYSLQSWLLARRRLRYDLTDCGNGTEKRTNVTAWNGRNGWRWCVMDISISCFAARLFVENLISDRGELFCFFSLCFCIKTEYCIQQRKKKTQESN